MPDAWVPVQVALWLGVAYITARIASERGRPFVVWIVFGLALPGVALICALSLSKEPPGFDAKPLTRLSLDTLSDKPRSPEDNHAA
jgi:hypothetical protein